MVVTDAEIKQIKAQAIREYPYECCGVVFTQRESGQRVLLECRNQQNELHEKNKVEHPRDASQAYSIHRDDLRKIEQFLNQGFDLTVLYHSHVDVGAYFSETDKRAATLGTPYPSYPDTVYLVVSVRGKGAIHVDDAAAFRWSEEKRDFAGVPFRLT
jgi:proteasome lid subunit RPN8/RPN11